VPSSGVHAVSGSPSKARDARASASPYRWLDDVNCVPGAVVPSASSMTGSAAFGSMRAVPERR
jgi:hypothetical protein